MQKRLMTFKEFTTGKTKDPGNSQVIVTLPRVSWYGLSTVV